MSLAKKITYISPQFKGTINLSDNSEGKYLQNDPTDEEMKDWIKENSSGDMFKDYGANIFNHGHLMNLKRSSKVIKENGKKFLYNVKYDLVVSLRFDGDSTFGKIPKELREFLEEYASSNEAERQRIKRIENQLRRKIGSQLEILE